MQTAEDSMDKQLDKTFEESLEQIRTLVDQLESGELSLEDSIDKFREGSTLLDHARKLISEAEVRVRVLTEDDEAEFGDE
jgi:exodeoxyribonuclease VII small subunit